MDEKKNPFTLDVLMYWGVTVIFLKKIGDMAAQRFVVLAWTSPRDFSLLCANSLFAAPSKKKKIWKLKKLKIWK